MIGAIIGDIVGSRFECENIKTKNFELFTEECEPTDDSVMTLAIAEAILSCGNDFDMLSAKAIESMQAIGRKYPRAGYGEDFYYWIHDDNPLPYNSWGNGAAMRVSACGYVANTIEAAKRLSRSVTEITHSHPEGLKGAESVAVAIYMANSGVALNEIRDYVSDNYYSQSFTLDEIRPHYHFDVSCQGSVPQAFAAFFESKSFEDAIRNAISIGGDSDTIAAIAGSIAEAYYGVPIRLRNRALTYLRNDLKEILLNFEAQYPAKNI